MESDVLHHGLRREFGGLLLQIELDGHRDLVARPTRVAPEAFTHAELKSFQFKRAREVCGGPAAGVLEREIQGNRLSDALEGELSVGPKPRFRGLDALGFEPGLRMIVGVEPFTVQ